MTEPNLLQALKRLADALYEATPPDDRTWYNARVCKAMEPMAELWLEAGAESSPSFALTIIGCSISSLIAMLEAVAEAQVNVSWN